MKTPLLRLLVCGFLLAFAASSASAQVQTGTIKALGISGKVTKVDAKGVSTPLANGAILTESDTVVTDAGSAVVLVFMNGSSVKLGASSMLAIEEFKMDPLADNASIEVAKLKAEPTVSKTALNLAYGELVGDVKKLNRSSSYSIKTPAGAAGIRGTTFRIVFTPSPDGKTFAFTLSTSDGTVVFSGTAPGSAEVPVETGSEVVVAAEVNTATGEVSNVQVLSQAISAEAARVIEAAVTEVIQQAQEAAVFTPEQQRADSSTPTTETPAETPKTETPRTEDPIPDPVITTPQPIDPTTVSRSGE